MLISPEYLEQNRLLHKQREDYGAGGHKWAGAIEQVARLAGTDRVLDYGCGKQTLARVLRKIKVHCYDPAIDGLDAIPPAHPVVVCTDVLEHIEPLCLDDVLRDIKRLAERFVFLVIATRPAKKTLPDGRNAHLIQQPIEWWLPQLMSRWELLSCKNLGGEFVFVGASKP